MIGDDEDGHWEEDLDGLGQLDAQYDIVQRCIIEVVQVRSLLIALSVFVLFLLLPCSGLC